MTSRQTDSEQTREQIRRILRQFDRFGVSGGDPEFIRASDASLEALRDARSRLAAIVRDDLRVQNLATLGAHELEGLRLELVRLCVLGRLQSYLSESEVPFPIYNFFAGFEENADGPWDGAARAAAWPA